MGTALVIKSANFAQNAVKQISYDYENWVFDYTIEELSDYSQTLTSGTQVIPSSDYDSIFANKKIAALKLNCLKSGDVNVYKYSKSNNTLELLQTFAVTTGINILILDESLDCGTDFLLGINTERNADILAKSNFGWTFRTTTTPTAKASPGFCIDFAYEGE